MARLSKQRRTLKRVLEWQLNRDVPDAELGRALDMGGATFSRRKDKDDFPTFEELDRIGTALGINPRWLQVEFGYLDEAELAAPPSSKPTTKKRRMVMPDYHAPPENPNL